MNMKEERKMGSHFPVFTKNEQPHKVLSVCYNFMYTLEYTSDYINSITF